MTGAAFRRFSPETARKCWSLISFAILVVLAAPVAGAQTPDAPNIGSAAAGDAQAFVFFTPPPTSGDSPITAYGASCVPGASAGASATGSGVVAPIVVGGLVNGTTYICSVTASNASGVSAASAGVGVTPILNAPLALIGVVSRKGHGAAGVFDIPIRTPLAIDGPVSVESRAGGGAHSVVFQFNATVNAIGQLSASDESSAIVNVAPTMAAHEVIVAIASIADNKRISILLPTVNGVAVNASATIGVLLGDVNESRTINATDVASAKSHSGHRTAGGNFRADVNASGAITAADISAIKARGSKTLTGIQTPVVARVEITHTGLMLTQSGATRQLKARALDAQGNQLNVPLTWTSSRPTNIAVDGTGLVTAATNNGASQIVVQAGGKQSTPLLAFVTQPAPGAILLTDSQIVGEPTETTPGAIASFNNTYQVRLSDVTPPAVGSILINTESKIVAGRVVSVDSTGNPMVVTLGLMTFHEMFPTLEMEETLDLSAAPIVVPANIAADYNVTRTGNTFTFVPKTAAAKTAERAVVQSAAINAPDRAAPFAGATGTRALPPFTSCERTFTGAGGGDENSPLPITLSAPPQFTVDISPTLDTKFKFLAPHIERFVFSAQPNVKVEGGVNVAVAFEGKIECKVELFSFRIPVGGPLSLVVGGLVPVGVGIEAGGKLTVATLGISAKAEVKGKVKAGIVCAGFSCSLETGLDDMTATLTPTVDAPSIGDLRLEPAFSAFGYMEAAVGNPVLSSIRFDFIKIKAGAELAGSFALKVSQLADPAYQSDYKLSLKASAGPSGNLSNALTLFGLANASVLELVISTDIAKSPSGIATGAVTASKATFVTGDAINFTVKLDPATVDFFPIIGPYNVKKIQLVRNVGGTIAVVGSVDASPGQTDFTFLFAAPDSGTAGQFSAFVVTTLLPFDLLALEVGTAMGPPDFMVANAAVRVRVPCTPVTTVSSVLPRPLPFALANGESLITISQQSEFIYVADFTVNLPIGRVCPNGGSDRGSTDVNAFLTIIPKVTGTMQIEKEDEPLDKVPPRTETMRVVAGTQLPLQRIFAIVDGSFSNAIQLRDTRIATLTFIPEVTVASASVQVRPACATTVSTFSPEKQTVPFALANGASVITVAQQSEFVYTVNFSANLPIGKTCASGASDGGSTDAVAFLTIIPRVSGTLTVERVMEPAGMNPTTIVSTIPVVAGTSVSLAPVSVLVNGSLDGIVQLSGARIATLTFAATP